MTDDDSREAALAALKADIYDALADIAAGRVKDLDPTSIEDRGRKLLAAQDELLAIIQSLKAGIRDARSGLTISDEEAMAEIRAVIDAARRAKM